MSLNRRAIAVQGIGYSNRLRAIQALLPDDETRSDWLRAPIKRKRKKRKHEDEALLLSLGGM
jgi:hypothetical protein